MSLVHSLPTNHIIRCRPLALVPPDLAQIFKIIRFLNILKILESGLTDISSAITLLGGPKLREFAACIDGLPEVCIDGHAYCIWAGERTGLKDVPAIGVKLRKQIKADYMQAAEDLNLEPFELQAITWCTWRRIHGVTK